MALRKNNIYQGDCVKLLNEIESGSVDLVFADPPFNIGYDYDVYDDSRKAEDYLVWCRQWIDGVYRALKPSGTFWLAIGDEFAAELKIESQKAGFHSRSWVIWYYTFGVNCANGFSRSHTHLFHFVKNPKDFTFNRSNPEIRVKSARQLVYADNRANPDGRLPDNTWITRPQDAPFFLSFSPSHDTWYFARVAGTFKEREGFHGCQMPEQLLARIIRSSSRPQDLVLDPFGGSGTTMCVAKKLGRQWMGLELSHEYVKYIKERLDKTEVGDLIDGPEDAVKSAPSTVNGKRREKSFDKKTEDTVINAYQNAGLGYPADYLLCNPEMNAQFVSECLAAGLGGNAYVWNRYLLRLRKSGKLPHATQRTTNVTPAQMDEYGYASEVAWRLLAIDYRKTLDDILCSPEFGREFDRIAAEFGPTTKIDSVAYRLAALSIRKRSHDARELAVAKYSELIERRKKLPRVEVGGSLEKLEKPGVFILYSGDVGFYVGESENMRARVELALSNENWRGLEPDSIAYIVEESNFAAKYAIKAALAMRERPLLNCRLLVHDAELLDRKDA